jgi:thiopeptide-type bacteriocin biosynthesis protein
VSPPFSPRSGLVLRTPLVDLGLLADWPADVARARARLAEVLARPEVAEAIAIAAPSVAEGIPLWAAAPTSERGQKLERALMAYVQRLATRCTPFGLFANVTALSRGPQSRLTLPGVDGVRRRTRVDLGVLWQLCEHLLKRPEVREAVRWRPNETALPVGDRVHFITGKQNGEARAYGLSAVDGTPVLEHALTFCRPGRRLAELRDELARELGDEVTADEVRDFVDELAAQQLLLADLRPMLTGQDALRELIAQLQGTGLALPELAPLEAIAAGLDALDEAPAGQGAQRHAGLVAQVAALGLSTDPGRALQVDAFTRARPVIADGVLRSLGQTAMALQSVFPAGRASLASFIDAFEQRWESAEVPLLQALDEEAGIGLLGAGVPSGEQPLLADVALGRAGTRTVSERGDLAAWRSELLLRARLAPDGVVTLTEAELARLGEPGAPGPGFGVMATLLAPASTAEPLGVLQGLSSASSPAHLSGRFCWLDEALAAGARADLEDQERRDPGRVYAEVVHAPEGRVGNVIARPRLRRTEIHLLSRGEARGDDVLSLDDLWLSVRDGRLVLRSRRLGREVVPTLSNAHNYQAGLPLYRFLAQLGADATRAGRSFSWGSLSGLPALPRVVLNRWVVSPATWVLPAAQLSRLKTADELRALGRRLDWPRYLLATEFDNTLPVDLENPLSCQTFLDTYGARSRVELVEDLQRRYGSPVQGPGGQLANEVVVPFSVDAPPAESPRFTAQDVERAFAPGGRWLYARAYVAHASADRLLRVVRGVVERFRSAGQLDRWFFIRYADPAPHLRLRFSGDPGFLLGTLWPALRQALGENVAADLLAREELGTYVREVERYGGPGTIETAEALFEVDSDAVLSLLELPGASGATRWRWALVGVADLFEALGLTRDERITALRGWRSSLARELGTPGPLETSLSRKARGLRQEVAQLLQRTSADAAVAAGFAVLDRRAKLLAERGAPLREAPPEQLTATRSAIAGALGHMACNRLIRSHQRPNELVIYDLLLRHLESEAARSQRRGTP